MEKKMSVYLKEYIFTWLKALVLYAIGGYLFGAAGGTGFDVMGGVFLAATVFGFTFFEKVVRFNLFGNSDSVIIFWILKVVISCLIGIIAFPVVNIYYIVRIIVEIVRSSGNAR